MNIFNLPRDEIVSGEFEVDGNKITLMETRGHEAEIVQACRENIVGSPCGYCGRPLSTLSEVKQSVWGGASYGWVHRDCYMKLREEDEEKYPPIT